MVYVSSNESFIQYLIKKGKFMKLLCYLLIAATLTKLNRQLYCYLAINSGFDFLPQSYYIANDEV